MKQISKIGIIRCHLNHFKNLARLTFFLFFFAIISNVHAQGETKATSFGIHAGVNIAGNWEFGKPKPGPSLSLHGAYSFFKNYMQLELVLFYDGRPDTEIIDIDKFSAIGLAAGIRANIRPQKNWNPSFVFFQGFAAVKEFYELFEEVFSYTFCLVFSNTLYQKHMVSFNVHAYFPSESEPFFFSEVLLLFNIKYGFWF